MSVSRRYPWVTLLCGLFAVVAWAQAEGLARWALEREAVRQGEVWRVWTCHFAHFTTSHLVWNLAVFLPTCGWLERVRPRLAGWFLVLCPLALSGVIGCFEPSLARYAGLSGLATGTLCLLAFVQLRHGEGEPRWFWWSVLGLTAGKILLENYLAAGFAADLGPGVRNVPLAHLGGALCAGFFAAVSRGGEREA